MVHRYQQCMPVPALPYQPTPNQRPLLQIENRSRFLLNQLTELLFARSALAQIVLNQVKPAPFRTANPRLRLPVTERKRRSQRFVPLNNPVQRPSKRLTIKITLQTQTEWNVIRLAYSLHLRQKPQSLLRKRKRKTLLPPRPHNGWQFSSRRHLQPLGKLCHYRPRKQIADRYFHIQNLLQTHHYPYCQQGMSAKLKKVVAPPHPFYPQHFRPDRRHRRFNLSHRRFIHTRRIGIRFRRRQRSPVQLSVRRQRY